MLKTIWTPEENQRMRKMAERGDSVMRAAGAFNRSIGSIRVQARKLSLHFSSIRALRKKMNGGR
jgi:hypothetical protein